MGIKEDALRNNGNISSTNGRLREASINPKDVFSHATGIAESLIKT